MSSIADFATEVAAAMPDVQVLLGEEYQHEADSPPRVVLLPADDLYGPPRRQTGDYPSVATRRVGLEARVWGEGDPNIAPEDQPPHADLRATELLLDRLIIALHQAAGPSLVVEGGAWEPTSASNRGRLYSLRFRIDVPVVQQPDNTLHTVTTFTEVLAPEAPAAIETTVVLGTDETGVPAP